MALLKYIAPSKMFNVHMRIRIANTWPVYVCGFTYLDYPQKLKCEYVRSDQFAKVFTLENFLPYSVKPPTSLMLKSAPPQSPHLTSFHSSHSHLYMKAHFPFKLHMYICIPFVSHTHTHPHTHTHTTPTHPHHTHTHTHTNTHTPTHPPTQPPTHPPTRTHTHIHTPHI